jgi:hypothetical protein
MPKQMMTMTKKNPPGKIRARDKRNHPWDIGPRVKAKPVTKADRWTVRPTGKGHSNNDSTAAETMVYRVCRNAIACYLSRLRQAVAIFVPSTLYSRYTVLKIAN